MSFTSIYQIFIQSEELKIGGFEKISFFVVFSAPLKSVKNWGSMNGTQSLRFP
jgi:hypothetical protein